MSNLQKKQNQKITQYASKKGVRRFYFSFFIFLSLGVFAFKSIYAQIENLYNQQNDEIAGISPLISAVADDDVNGVRFFSKAGKSLVNQKNLGGATAIHIACRQKNFEIVKVLIQNSADINVADNEGWTPLMRASLAADVQIISLLLDNGAKANNINNIGESAIIHAATSNCDECLDVIFEKFNFIKLMDANILKDQLTKAFIIARNHENQVAQDMIEAYLDRLLKMMPLIERQKQFDDTLSEVKKDEDLAQEAEAKVSLQEFPTIVKNNLKNEVMNQWVGNEAVQSNITKKKFKFIQGKNWQESEEIMIEKKKLPQVTAQPLLPESKNLAIADKKEVIAQSQPIQNQQDEKTVIFVLRDAKTTKNSTAQKDADLTASNAESSSTPEILMPIIKDSASQSSVHFIFKRGEDDKNKKEEKRISQSFKLEKSSKQQSFKNDKFYKLKQVELPPEITKKEEALQKQKFYKFKSDNSVVVEPITSEPIVIQ